MCGIAGFWEPLRPRDPEESRRLAASMSAALVHRGPDDGAVYVDASAGFAVGHRRLAIVDLSPCGRQPMLSAQQRYVLAFNGEVYNHRELRRRLAQAGHVFRGHSDTEVLLAAIEQWGLERALRIAAGMFAFALWDRQERILYLARDRLGEKPLYYGTIGDGFFFASELKALARHPRFRPTIDPEALPAYLRHNVIPAPRSIYREIRKLPPGTYLTLDADRLPQPPEPRQYWSVAEVVAASAASRLPADPQLVVDTVERQLKAVVAEQMVADVPLGAFLSGGVDSSTIVALMQAQSSRPVRTFTIGFDSPEFDEADYARQVARCLGTDHTECYVSGREALDVVPALADIYDEPFADSSQIPTYLVAKIARRYVTVSLSGDGGDEVFAGYAWYRRALRLWERIRAVPLLTRAVGSAFADRARDAAARGLASLVGRLAPTGLKKTLGSARLLKGIDMLRHCDDIVELHEWLIATHWHGNGEVLARPSTPTNLRHHRLPAVNPLDKLQCFDMLTFLPNDILVKVDRATMAVSLESRAPFLDHRVVETALRIPASLRMGAGSTKWPLRQILYRYLPRTLVDRPKYGFTVPLAAWLRGPLRSWAQELLSHRRLKEHGFFRSETIERLWREHCSGERNWHRQLWTILMFQAWHERWREMPSPVPAARNDAFDCERNRSDLCLS